jgi:hypothetical protein
VAPVLLGDLPAEQRSDQLVALDEVVEGVQPALERPPAAAPLEDRRGLLRHAVHATDSLR